jgi:chromosomal replication initiation ATPase DnaA
MLQTVDDLWGEPPDKRRDHLTVAYVTSLVALATDTPAREIGSRGRSTATAARARHMAIYLAHIALSWPLSRVATAFSRDRTTVSHAVHVIEDLRDDPDFDDRLTRLEDCVRQAADSRETADDRR